MKADETLKAETTESLRRLLPRGSRVATLQIDGSGCADYRRVFVASDGAVHEITGRAARAIGVKYDTKRGTIRINGGGFDKGFEIVEALAHALHGRDQTVATLTLKHDRL